MKRPMSTQLREQEGAFLSAGVRKSNVPRPVCSSFYWRYAEALRWASQRGRRIKP